LPPTTDQVGKLSVARKDLRKALPPRKILKRLTTLEMANNGVKPHTDKNKQVADN